MYVCVCVCVLCAIVYVFVVCKGLEAHFKMSFDTFIICGFRCVCVCVIVCVCLCVQVCVSREFSIIRERRHVTPCLSSAPSSTGYCERLWTSHALQCNTYLCDDCSQYGLQSNMLLPKYRSGNPLSSNFHDFLKQSHEKLFHLQQ